MSGERPGAELARRLRLAPRAPRTLESLRPVLPKAGYLVMPEWFLAQSVLFTGAAFLASLIVPASVVVIHFAGGGVHPLQWIVAFALPPAVAALVYAVRLQWPRARVPLRARALEAQMPFAINYMSTLASGRLHLDQIFADLAQQDVYGEVAKECALIHRDLAFLGRDLVGALNAAIARSPSRKWEDFLQGLLITLTSGGDLQGFLRAKSEQYFGELRTLQRGFLDNLALLAEVFVVMVVATPLLFLILLSILTLFGRTAQDVLLLGYALVFLLLPLTQFAFGTVIRLMTPEG